MRTLVNSFIKGATGAAFGLLVLSSVLHAEQTAIPLLLQFGSANGEMIISPPHVTLTAGERYRLTIENPSPMTHYIGLPELARAVATEDLKVEHRLVAARVWDRPRAPRELGKVVDRSKGVSGQGSVAPATMRAGLQSPNRKVRGVIHPSVKVAPTTWVATRSPNALRTPRTYERRPVALYAASKITWTFVAGPAGNYVLGCAVKSHKMAIEVEIL